MSKDEALKLALEALESSRVFVTTREKIKHPEGTEWYDQAITTIKEALAQPEQNSTYTYASNLAKTIWQKHYMKDSPEWKPLDTTEGVLTQIDNMTCGLVREKPAQPKQEPVAYDKTEMNCFVQDLYDKKMQEGKHGHYETMFHVVNQAIKKVPPKRTWVGLTDEEIEQVRLAIMGVAYWCADENMPEAYNARKVCCAHVLGILVKAQEK